MIVDPVVCALGFVFLYISLTAGALTLEEAGLFILIALRVMPVVKQALSARQGLLSQSGFLDSLRRRFAEIAAAQEPDGGIRRLDAVREAVSFDAVRYNYGAGDVDRKSTRLNSSH